MSYGFVFDKLARSDKQSFDGKLGDAGGSKTPERRISSTKFDFLGTIYSNQIVRSSLGLLIDKTIIRKILPC